MSSDLSDVLRDMAEDRRREDQADDDVGEPLEAAQPGDPADATAPPESAAETESESQTETQPQSEVSPEDPSEKLAALEEQVADESGGWVGAAAAHQSAGGLRRDRGHRGLQTAAVPVLITVGLLLILLGAWGTAVVNEFQIILSDRPDAERMARAMILIGYPLGAALIAGAGFFIYQLRRH